MTSEKTVMITLPKIDKRGAIAVAVMWAVVAAIAVAVALGGPVVLLKVMAAVLVLGLAALLTVGTYMAFRQDSSPYSY